MWWRHGGIKINNHYWKKEEEKKFNIIIIFYRSFTNAQANNKGLTSVKRMTQNKAERNSLPKKYPKKEAIKFILFRVYNFSGIFFPLARYCALSLRVLSTIYYCVFGFNFNSHRHFDPHCKYSYVKRDEHEHICEISVNLSLVVHKPTGFFSVDFNVFQPKKSKEK